MLSNLGRGSADVPNMNSGRKGIVLHLGWEGEGITCRNSPPWLPRACGQFEEGGELEQLGCSLVEGKRVLLRECSALTLLHIDQLGSCLANTHTPATTCFS